MARLFVTFTLYRYGFFSHSALASGQGDEDVRVWLHESREHTSQRHWQVQRFTSGNKITKNKLGFKVYRLFSLKLSATQGAY